MTHNSLYSFPWGWLEGDGPLFWRQVLLYISSGYKGDFSDLWDVDNELVNITVFSFTLFRQHKILLLHYRYDLYNNTTLLYTVMTLHFYLTFAENNIFTMYFPFNPWSFPYPLLPQTRKQNNRAPKRSWHVLPPGRLMPWNNLQTTQTHKTDLNWGMLPRKRDYPFEY